MTKHQFSTNINCGSCIRSVTGFLNEVKGIEQWEVDTDDPRKLLTVEGAASVDAILEAVKEAGFDAKLMEN